jgi:hypothetical protein
VQRAWSGHGRGLHRQIGRTHVARWLRPFEGRRPAWL